MDPQKIKLEDSWKKILLNEFEKDYMQDLKKFLVSELQQGKMIYPKGSEIFSALNITPLDDVKVVILGQDPYHGPNQAHGLCFSVKKGVPAPPSLKNIFKELASDIGIKIPTHGELTSWAQQGVLLLNTVLTVEEGKAASHKGRGWEFFTDKVISILGDREDPLVFLLWGNFAQSKASLIKKHHKILKCAHPSPLSAHNGFIGSKHFSKTNEYLVSIGKKPIDWSIH
ncbi:MAG: uracil-DNA glycosylase [Oligoflexia bacterium]|nr:uracil-DNA glycosylase [Oligoflexia bacterium]